MENTSGILPVEFKVLIKQDVVEKKSEGGIILTETTVERNQIAQVKGTVIAIGGDAFKEWEGIIPQVGDKVLTAQYAGVKADGKDNEEYRLINDNDITAVLEE